MMVQPVNPVVAGFCNQVLEQNEAELQVSRFSKLKGFREASTPSVVTIRKFAGQDCIGNMRFRRHNGQWFPVN